jgi:hypothetical protein
MESSYKNMLIGAFVTSGVDAGLAAYNAVNPAMNGNVLYTVIHPAIPPLNNWIADAGVPLILYGLGKVTKKPMLKQMAKGGAIYGISELLGQTLYRVALVAQGQTPVASYSIVR